MEGANSLKRKGRRWEKGNIPGAVEIGTMGVAKTSVVDVAEAGAATVSEIGAMGMAETSAAGVAGMGAVGIEMSAIVSGSSGIFVIRRMNMQNK